MKRKRIVLCVLIMIWMIIIFLFSHQESTKSTMTSSTVSSKIVKIFPGLNKLSQEEKQFLVETIEPFLRKLAHYGIYMMGGILICLFFTTYPLTDWKTILYSQLFGSTYAILDELHQYYIPGRSAEIRDVLLDSLGIITGIIGIMLIYKIIEKRKQRKEGDNIND